MQKLISAKWIILITVLINVVTTFTLVTIFPSGMGMANASSKNNCANPKPVFRAFKSGANADYTGKLFANAGTGNRELAKMDIKFSGTAPKSDTDGGNLTEVFFWATAIAGNPFNFKTVGTGDNGLDTSKPSHLSDFTLNLKDNNGHIHFINTAFTGNGTQIKGDFAISGGKDDRANGYFIAG